MESNSNSTTNRTKTADSFYKGATPIGKLKNPNDSPSLDHVVKGKKEEKETLERLKCRSEGPLSKALHPETSETLMRLSFPEQVLGVFGNHEEMPHPGSENVFLNMEVQDPSKKPGEGFSGCFSFMSSVEIKDVRAFLQFSCFIVKDFTHYDVKVLNMPNGTQEEISSSLEEKKTRKSSFGILAEETTETKIPKGIERRHGFGQIQHQRLLKTPMEAIKWSSKRIKIKVDPPVNHLIIVPFKMKLPKDIPSSKSAYFLHHGCQVRNHLKKKQTLTSISIEFRVKVVLSVLLNDEVVVKEKSIPLEIQPESKGPKFQENEWSFDLNESGDSPSEQPSCCQLFSFFSKTFHFSFKMKICDNCPSQVTLELSGSSFDLEDAENLVLVLAYRLKMDQETHEIDYWDCPFKPEAKKPFNFKTSFNLKELYLKPSFEIGDCTLENLAKVFLVYNKSHMRKTGEMHKELFSSPFEVKGSLKVKHPQAHKELGRPNDKKAIKFFQKSPFKSSSKGVTLLPMIPLIMESRNSEELFG